MRKPLAALGALLGTSMVLAACFVDSSLQSGGSPEGGADALSEAGGGDGNGGMDAPADAEPDVPLLPTCNGGVCAPPVPMDWSGPLALYNAAGPAPACPAAYPTVAFDGMRGLTASPATCACTCGPPSGSACSGSYAVYTNTNCGTLCNSFALNQCVSTSSCNGGNSVRVTVTASGGSCAPNPTKAVPSAAWAAVGRACGGATATTGCFGGDQCYPVPSGAFGQRLCISKAGDQSCPAGYPIKNVFFTGLMDSRDCSACTCGSPSGVACTGGTVTLYDANSCSGSSTTIAADNTCKSTSGITTISAKFAQIPTPSGGTCAPSGGTATGQATPTGATTFCCR